jgi:hypothetical protein
MIKFQEKSGFRFHVKNGSQMSEIVDAPGELSAIHITKSNIFVSFDNFKGPNMMAGNVLCFRPDGSYLWTLDISKAIKQSSVPNHFGSAFHYSDGKYCVGDADNIEWLLDMNTGKIEFIPFQKPS